jgi:nondiscriminating glutamyl-tRNA synthetase
MNGEDFKFIKLGGEMKFKFIKPGEIRTRFAPSPTGFLHLGSARTALFNYLFAKKYQGSFILRIEDTDVERSKPEFEKDVLENLRWLGIEWNEGPRTEAGLSAGQDRYFGDYGPYRQSERKQIYQKYLEKLLNEGKAYYCFCSEEELEAQRQYQMSIGEAPRYSGKCANLSKEEVKKCLAEGKKSVIRFKVEAKKVEFEDLIRGKIEFDASLLGDFVIAKDLVTPLYNFGVVVDDFEMRISYIIRGEEHISNTPKQILIQEALNISQPKYAHLPLILGPDRSKLSKRHGAVSVALYRKSGYLAEALINFMAFLGWNPGTEREIYSLASLIKEFSIERIQKGGAVFNIKRLDFLNGFYIRQKSIERLTELIIPYWIKAGLIKGRGNPEPEPLKLPLEEKAQFIIKETGEEISLEILKKIVSLYQERLKKLSEIVELTDFFFKEKFEYKKELLKWKDMGDKEIRQSLDKLLKMLYKIKEGEFTKENLEKILLPESEKFTREIKKPMEDRGYFLWPLRVALTGKETSAGPFEIAEILGRERVLKRIEEAKRKL